MLVVLSRRKDGRGEAQKTKNYKTSAQDLFSSGLGDKNPSLGFSIELAGLTMVEKLPKIQKISSGCRGCSVSAQQVANISFAMIHRANRSLLFCPVC